MKSNIELFKEMKEKLYPPPKEDGCPHHITETVDHGMIVCIDCAQILRENYVDRLTNWGNHCQRQNYTYNRCNYFRNYLNESAIDISDSTEDIMWDYETLLKKYNQKKYPRKSYLNSNYVMYQLLNKHGYQVTGKPIKSNKSMIWHEEVTKKLFKELGWKHIENMEWHDKVAMKLFEELGCKDLPWQPYHDKVAMKLFKELGCKGLP